MSSSRPLGRMLVSRELGREVEIDSEKVARGSFYTTHSNWLSDPVKEFLAIHLPLANGRVLDPFAGDGHLLEAIASDAELGGLVTQVNGYDIAHPKWPNNDSLIEIPNPQHALILTNPPFLANHSARRKSVLPLVKKYFDTTGEENLYRIALNNALANSDFVVAILPEAFLLSSFPKERLERVVVIEDQLFSETEAPTVVACFAGPSQAKVFIGNRPVGVLSEILALRKPKIANRSKVRFNLPAGRVGLRAVDGASGEHPIQFMIAEEFNYSAKKVRVSSRLMTYLDIDGLASERLAKVIERANFLLTRLRAESCDLVLAPFKGNDKLGRRRRRLDYALARRILRQAVEQLEAEQ